MAVVLCDPRVFKETNCQTRARRAAECAPYRVTAYSMLPEEVFAFVPPLFLRYFCLKLMTRG
jgi:hypothetical protein